MRSPDVYKEIFNLISDAIVLVDNSDGRILEANSAAVELYGYSYAELRRMCNTDVSAEPEKTQHATCLHSSRIPVRYHKKKDGTVFPVEIDAKHHNWHGSDVHICVIREITNKLATEAERRKNSQRFKALCDNSGDAIFIHGEDGNIQDANQEACRRYGYSLEEFLRMRIEDVDEKQFHSRITSRLSQTANGERAVFVSLHRAKSGNLLPVEVTARRVDFVDESFIIATCRDITARMKAEDALRESEEKYRILLEESSDSIFSMTPEGRYRYVNRAFSKGVGKPVEEIIGNTLWDVFPQEEADRRFAVLSDVVTTGIMKVLEARIPRTDGDRYFMTTITPIKGARGDVISVICSARNITQIKTTEQALREMTWLLEAQTHELLRSNELLEQRVKERTAALQEINTRFTQLAEHSRTVIWEVNAQGLYTYISQMSEAVYGLRPEEITERMYFYDLLPVGERETIMAAAFAVFSKKEPFVNFEHSSVSSANNHHIWVNVSGIPVLGADGTLLGYRGADTDISEKKRFQEQLSQAQKLESVGRLAGGVAHDFNNKLMVILGCVELARMDINNSAAILGHLDEIAIAAEHSRRLTMQLLGFSRQQVVKPLALDVNVCISDSLKSLSRLIRKRSPCAFTPGDNLWKIRIDPVQLDQIVMNMTLNAWDAMPQEGTFTIVTRNITLNEEQSNKAIDAMPGDYVRITFSDTGTGMDQHTLEHIFEPFFTTKEQGKGTGLGLATIHGIVHQNNGFIEVRSEPGHGAVFWVYLPRHDPRAEETEQSQHYSEVTPDS